MVEPGGRPMQMCQLTLTPSESSDPLEGLGFLTLMVPTRVGVVVFWRRNDTERTLDHLFPPFS